MRNNCLNTVRSYFGLNAKKQQPLRLPSFTHFPLNEKIMKYLQTEDIHTPSYVQYGLMSKIFDKNSTGQQFHIVSPTGSGKTLAYMLPIANQLKRQQQIEQCVLTKSQRPRALVLTSTKQLVLQVKNVAKQISHHSKLKCQGLGLGRSLNQQKQIMNKGIDVLICNFIRFQRMLNRRQVYLSLLDYIVIDQIDTMFQSQKKNMDLVFNNIVSPKISQNPNLKVILSSATNPPNLNTYLKQKLPKLQKIVDNKVHVNLQNIKHQFVQCYQYDKHQPLYKEIKQSKGNKIMIFCNTIKSLHQLQYYLNDQGVQVLTLHSQLNKIARLKNYQAFRDQQKGVMLATDLGARGLHFPKLQKIINYDFPLTTCDYLQRAGRTGRAGQKGQVVSLYFKKHLPIINQLKDASFTTPLKIKNSAYGFKNREQSKTNKNTSQ